ncbi:hypothetical protein C7212DRAFT_341921 [Tuber magnatum]|uniref:Uncharacterized protein n=1 Tax=Tuber magnatum TaxID=42249 RepID=A0A317SYY9_9PEZI|nr:hypothetical protein C7212DRAFT_341921 [Tuber magnatum]
MFISVEPKEYSSTVQKSIYDAIIVDGRVFTDSPATPGLKTKRRSVIANSLSLSFFLFLQRYAPGSTVPLPPTIPQQMKQIPSNPPDYLDQTRDRPTTNTQLVLPMNRTPDATYQYSYNRTSTVPQHLLLWKLRRQLFHYENSTTAALAFQNFGRDVTCK